MRQETTTQEQCRCLWPSGMKKQQMDARLTGLVGALGRTKAVTFVCLVLDGIRTHRMGHPENVF